MRASQRFLFLSAVIDMASAQPDVVIEHIKNNIKPRVDLPSRKQKPAGGCGAGFVISAMMNLCQ
jgi:hypothetical protein